jgi:hypothetical protein
VLCDVGIRARRHHRRSDLERHRQRKNPGLARGFRARWRSGGVRRRHHGHRHGFDLQNGIPVFSAATSGKLQASAAVAVGMLYFTNGGFFYAYAPS